MYGSQTSKQVNEQSIPSPKTIYAKSKVWAEKLKKLADKNFSQVLFKKWYYLWIFPRMEFVCLNDCLQAFLIKKSSFK